MALRTEFDPQDASNRLITSPLDVRYTQTLIRENGYNYYELHRTAEAEVQYLGLSLAAATECKKYFEALLTRRMKNWKYISGAWRAIEVIAQPNTVTISATSGDDYSVTISISEDDTAYSQDFATDPASLFDIDIINIRKYPTDAAATLPVIALSGAYTYEAARQREGAYYPTFIFEQVGWTQQMYMTTEIAYRYDHDFSAGTGWHTPEYWEVGYYDGRLYIALGTSSSWYNLTVRIKRGASGAPSYAFARAGSRISAQYTGTDAGRICIDGVNSSVVLDAWKIDAQRYDERFAANGGWKIATFTVNQGAGGTGGNNLDITIANDNNTTNYRVRFDGDDWVEPTSPVT